MSSDDDELVALRAKLADLKERERAHYERLQRTLAIHAEQDRYHRDAEATQAAFDQWSQRQIEMTMAQLTISVQKELQHEAEAEQARLRMPDPPEGQRLLEEGRRREKVLRIRHVEELLKAITEKAS